MKQQIEITFYQHEERKIVIVGILIKSLSYF